MLICHVYFSDYISGFFKSELMFFFQFCTVYFNITKDNIVQDHT